MTTPAPEPLPGLFTPANFKAPPGPPVALGAALAIWLFARADLVQSLMALLVAALVGIAYLRQRREAAEARAEADALAAQAAEMEAALATLQGLQAQLRSAQPAAAKPATERRSA